MGFGTLGANIKSPSVLAAPGKVLTDSKIRRRSPSDPSSPRGVPVSPGSLSVLWCRPKGGIWANLATRALGLLEAGGDTVALAASVLIKWTPILVSRLQTWLRSGSGSVIIGLVRTAAMASLILGLRLHTLST